MFLPTEDNFATKGSRSLKKEVWVSRRSALSCGGVSVIPLVGLDSAIQEYSHNRRICWQFEPHPGFEKMISKDNTEGIGSFEISIMGKDKLWKYLNETAERLSKETETSVDLNFLTPYEAIKLVCETIQDRVAYEYLIIGKEGKRMVECGEIKKTLRPELVDLCKANPDKFDSETKKLEIKIDSMTADQILEGGFGVCRHIAATASTMYGLLKERQRGLMLNGTYLAYHGQNVGNQQLRSIIESHSYNIFLVTSPSGEVAISIVDPTWMLDEDSELDYTWKRISQACSFLSEYGRSIGMKDVEKTVSALVSEGVSRMENYFSENKLSLYSNGDEPCVSEFLSDYISLIDQGNVGRSGETLSHMIRFLSNYDCDRVRALLEVLGRPSYEFVNCQDEKTIQRGRFAELNRELKNIDFLSGSKMDNLVLTETLMRTIDQFSLKWLLFLEKRIRNLDAEDFEYLGLVGHCVRACIALKTAPSEVSQLQKIQQALNVVRAHRILGDLLSFGGIYLNV
ncbi:MAG: hypothetical protein UW64_C0009G0013 [Microgenomates group bacterium GW2011_GWC1_44_37]|uniref:Uncharacterized protein n=1 Tax=Candidatus Collierbacteria bacterium GW2011_GWB2_44_22 TaxID=1618387 RepID=A0A0G1HVW0_9BACT|nr:MAG: hypothetical protein UW31_C0002G0013 [Candidatus Collierbacteria bacterium GW2011_GWA2_44_13]KKT51221.1 MAG: hypothetical protein UW44_C0014G0013 [Candidatus Collierbacteria bacterium GW2011_GWB2_44_22]KKT62181.1 MAG: hypothetical protein UW56_C0010G0013 [Candidatus Collierbacteria bacterium GW2011_GWD1_44_27]KKT65668.1 MAG: hypothetical protein UW58_C0023G0011 [Candidatus Collierbacteria bacterium GW2011_GWC2_44_30]KKT68801.1 MAG: hypothetical protein UW64_C0009G0013 [Microgenomates gr